MSEAARIPAPHINGRVQRKVPTFHRPSISVGGVAADGAPAQARVWRNVPVTQIAAGDVIPDFGVVTSVHESRFVPSAGVLTSPAVEPDGFHWTVTIMGASTRTFHGSDVVFAFTAPAG